MSSKFQKKRLAIAVSSAIACSLSSMAFAADEDNKNEADNKEIEVIEVRGMRDNLMSAQNLKRYADTVKDIIVASDISALPDKSVTEALQRVPGVTIERFAASNDPKHFADEGTGVLVRGLDRVRSEINGRDAFSANANGGLSYEDFPAELLGAVEVYKNQTADLVAGGIAGTVNLVTRKAFDSDEAIIAASAQANYGDYSEETTPSFSALFADSWETNKAGKFGFLIAASSSRFKTSGDGFGLGNFHSRGTTPELSTDVWGTHHGGIIAGEWGGRCVPGTTENWRGCVDDNPQIDHPRWNPDALPYTEEEAAAYVFPFEGGKATAFDDGIFAPSGYAITSADNDRKRHGITTSLQWQSPDERITATLEHINSKSSLEYRERVILNTDTGFQPWNPSALDWIDQAEQGHPATTDANGYVTSGIGIGQEDNVPVQFRSRFNDSENTVEDTALNLVFKATDLLTVSFDYQHIDSERLLSNNNITSRINGNQSGEHAPFFLDLRGSTPTIEFLNANTSNPPDVAEPVLNAETGDLDFSHPILRISNGTQHEEHNEATSDSFKLDIEYALDGAFTSVKAGLYYSEKELIVRDTDYEGWQSLSNPWAASTAYQASPQVVPELYERVGFADHFNGQTFIGENNSFLFPRMDLVEDYAQTLADGCGTWIATGTAQDGQGGCAQAYADIADRTHTHFAPRHISSSETERTEFYIRGDFDFDLENLDILVKGNIGLRYVDYQLKSTGGINLPATSRRGTNANKSLEQLIQTQYTDLYDLASGESFSSTIDGADYTTLLPSLNLSFALTDELIVRFGASKGIYFPSLVQSANKMNISLNYEEVFLNPEAGKDDSAENPADWVNPTVELDNIEISANARNAFLEPEESINIDLTTEWYFADAGSLTVGLFHKKLSNIIRNETRQTEVTVGNITYPVSAYGPANTGSGTIRGVEFAYSQFYDMLPGAWSGLGLQLNFTYIDQNDLEDPNTNPTEGLKFRGDGSPVVDNRNSFRQFTGLPLQGYSDSNFNIVGMYEKYGFSARLAYTWRSDYLLTLRESEEFVPAYSKDQGMMDASLFYDVAEGIKVGLQVSNLLDEKTQTQYQQNQEGIRTDAFSFTTDRRYAFIVRGTF